PAVRLRAGVRRGQRSQGAQGPAHQRGPRRHGRRQARRPRRREGRHPLRVRAAPRRRRAAPPRPPRRLQGVPEDHHRRQDHPRPEVEVTRQTVTQAAEEQSKSALAVIGNYQASLGALLPSHIKPETFIRLCQGALRRNKDLARIANTGPGFESFLHALMDAARLGHEPGTEQYYLVPFGNEIVGIEGYRGVVERMYRAGAVSSVKAELVKAGDTFQW